MTLRSKLINILKNWRASLIIRLKFLAFLFFSIERERIRIENRPDPDTTLEMKPDPNSPNEIALKFILSIYILVENVG